MNDWLSRRSTGQFFWFWVACMSVAGLLGAAALHWLGNSHIGVRLLITYGLTFPVITAIPVTLKRRWTQSSSTDDTEQ